MCGILGLYAPTLSLGEIEPQIVAMQQALNHRGPDDRGVFVCSETGMGLGHLRLSILDLSAAGHQPMTSATGRYVISFNGEIYNYQEIKQQLVAADPQLSFRGASDTEVILCAIEQWGLKRTLGSLRGMFAFGLWDQKQRSLILVRDRLGKKPLYYAWSKRTFIFASELKAFKAVKSFSASINRDALALYFEHNYIPTPHSIYQGVYKLPAGTFLELSLDHLQNKPEFSAFKDEPLRLSPRSYWSVEQCLTGLYEKRARGEQESDSEASLYAQFKALLSESVCLRMIADVPFGALLSGGIDSSLIVALMRSLSSTPVKTFSVGFENKSFNELPYAAAIAKHLGTEHYQQVLSSRDLLDVVPLMSQIYDEPFADSSQIPTYLVSKMARTKVTVCLSGDGGDELFGGYLRYPWAERAWGMLAYLPPALKKIIAEALTLPSVKAWDTVLGVFNKLTAGSFNFHHPGDKVYKLAKVLNLQTREDLYTRLITHWDNSRELVLGSQAIKAQTNDRESWPKDISYLDFMRFHDLRCYLPDDILCKVDRASMASGLEARAPLLDHKLLEWSLGLPANFLRVNGQSKYFMRKFLAEHLPVSLFDRPKQGFAIPLADWLRKELRDWCEALIEPHKLEEQGFLNAKLVQQKWQEHLSGRHNWHYYIWDVLMFQAWLEAK